jgi:peptide chain release factor 2
LWCSTPTSTPHGGVFDPEQSERRLAELEELTAAPELWNDRAAAETTLAELKRLKGRIEPWKGVRAAAGELETLCELAEEEGSEELSEEIEAGLVELEDRFGALNLQSLLAGPHDRADCFLTIHAGAGGTEACDWVSMLLRMYLRWAEERSLGTEVIDLTEAEGGLKSTTMQLSGEYSYGYLRAETGIHRLVRISPFDANKRRHTTFASVFASPVLDDAADVEVRPEEIRVDTYRASGAGGQHVNKTDSAVRITHLATGIVVQCQNERSQHKNRATAMKVLRSRLFEHHEAERRSKLEAIQGDKKDISWGNQIRSYVFQPYTMVKDHRTKHENGNVQAVMDGRIDPFIESYLRMAASA